MKKETSRGIKKQVISILFILLLFGLTIFVLAKSTTELSFSNIIDFLKSSNPAYIAAAFICMLLFIFFEGLSVHTICRRLDNKRPLYSCVCYATADIYYSAITPCASGGQPASGYYMIKDGVDGGTTSFGLVLNLTAYISAILVIAAAAFLIDVFAVDFGIFSQADFFSKLLIIIGIVVQTALLVFFVLCMRCHNLVLKAGNGAIKLLAKIKIIRKPDKWTTRYTAVVKKYKIGYEHIKLHKTLFLEALILNVIQRMSQVLITCFVCYSVSDKIPFYELVAMQCYILVGYNSIPLPGGTGAYEYLYLSLYGLAYNNNAFVTSSMMVSRVISFYISMILCGIVTLVYHISVTRRSGAHPAENGQTEQTTRTEQTDDEQSPQGE